MWNTEIEKQVIEIYHWSYGWYRIYAKAAVDCESNKNKMFYGTLLPNIIVSLFSGVVVLYYQENEIPNWVNIINLIFNIIITMLVLIKNKVDQANDKSAYDLLTQRNYSLFSNIRRQMAMPVNQRQQGEEYLIWITKEYDQLNNTNILDESYFTWYQKIADEKKLPMPGMIDNFTIERSSTSNISDNFFKKEMEKTNDKVASIIDDWKVKPSKSKSMHAIISKLELTPPPPRLIRSSQGLVAAAPYENESNNMIKRKPTVDDLFPVNVDNSPSGKSTNFKDKGKEKINNDINNNDNNDNDDYDIKEKTVDDGYDNSEDRKKESPVLDKQEVMSDSNGSKKSTINGSKKLTPNRNTFKNLLNREDMFDDTKMKYEISRYME